VRPLSLTPTRVCKTETPTGTRMLSTLMWSCNPPSASQLSARHPRFLSLSTNGIEKISNLAGLESLQCLSMGRNLIKKLEGLEPVAATLEELWLSYNALEKLVSCLFTLEP